MKVKQKALDEVNEITYDTKTGITTTLVHTFKPCIDLFDGNEHIAHYENDTEFIEDFKKMKQENKQLKDKISKIETLIINHNCDTGDIYYKYNSRFLKSELKQRILDIVYEQGSDSNE